MIQDLKKWPYCANIQVEKEKNIQVMRINGEWFAPSEFILDYINRYNEKPNTIIDYVDGKLMSLLSLKQS